MAMNQLSQKICTLKVVSQKWFKSQEIDPEEIDTALQRLTRGVQAMAQVLHRKKSVVETPSNSWLIPLYITGGF